MEQLLNKIRSKKFSFARMPPAMNLDQEVVRMCDIEEIFSIPIEPPVKPDFTEITLNDYEKLGDTFIDAKTDSPLTQWRIIAGMLSSIGFKIIKK